jgi:hypothetical protein
MGENKCLPAPRRTWRGLSRRRPTRPLDRGGEAALRAALRRWRRPPAGSNRPGRGGWPPAWWPALTPAQVQALVGAGVTLAVALWEHFRGRWER